MTSTENKERDFLKYSETPPYGLLVITALFRHLAKTAIHDFLEEIMYRKKKNTR